MQWKAGWEVKIIKLSTAVTNYSSILHNILGDRGAVSQAGRNSPTDCPWVSEDDSTIDSI